MQPERTSLIGTRIREYEILDVIGKGGMGAVYKARHVLLDEERAIKVIQSRLADDSAFVDRFLREAKMLVKLHHPNLIQLYEFGTLEDGSFFMVLELARGESMLALLRREGRIPIAQAVKIIREAALGLHSAHQKGIVHRDVSPDNLLLVETDRNKQITKVIDFGIAKPLFEGTQGVTATNVFVGKPEYCSPEQCGILEPGETIDARSDIYSLGITFYHALAGRLPFYATTPQGYLVRHVSEAAKPISTNFQDGQFPAALEHVVMKMLAKNRELRYQTLEEFVHDLDELERKEDTKSEVWTAQMQVGTGQLNAGDMFARRYLIERKLGEGGMGAVYKATDRILEVAVALKVMSPGRVLSKGTLERFKREVILARKVAHPNVCRIYDMGESEGTHYVSMEFLEGRTLAEVLQAEGIPALETGVPLIKQVLHALQEAHHVGVIHRDLKPQNIMIDLRQKAHIMDFGISISSGASRITQTGVLVGTPFYMAPEQFEEKPIDHRTDIYAIGIILYQMFTGRLPYEATTPIAVVLAHLNSTPSRPSQLNPEIPAVLESVILKAMEKDPMKRFQDVEEFLTALDQLGKLAKTPLPLTPIPQTPQRKRDPEPFVRASNIPDPVHENMQTVDAAMPSPSVGPSRNQQLASPEEEKVTPSQVTPLIAEERKPASSVLSGRWKLGIVILILLILAGLFVSRFKQTTNSSNAAPPPKTALQAVTLVSIDALPWANIKVTPESKDIQLQNIPDEEKVTPCSFALPPGSYFLELTNDVTTTPILEKIQVNAATENTFQFTMPGHDPKMLLMKLRKK